MPHGHPRKPDTCAEAAVAGTRLDESDGAREGSAEGGERFESATWVHKAQVLPKEGCRLKRQVARRLTGKETESWEIIYFKFYKSQLPVVEKALETAGLMLAPTYRRPHCKWG